MLEAVLIVVLFAWNIYLRIVLTNTRVKLKDTEIRLRWAKQTLKAVRGKEADGSGNND